MKLECWTLAIVGAETGDEPWAEIHPTHADALASVVKGFEPRLSHLTPAQRADEKIVSDALDERAVFTIEPAVIETDNLAESE